MPYFYKMKICLYLGVLLILCGKAFCYMGEEYDLLKLGESVQTHFNEDAGNDGFGAFEFNSKDAVSDPVADTDIAGQLLPGRFIITTKFKRNSTKSAYLFALSNGRRIELGLKLTAASPTVTRATLSCECLGTKTVSVDYFTPDDWTEMAVAVTDDYVFLYRDCIEVGNAALATPPREFKISESSTMYVAHYKDNGNDLHFEGLIQSIKLYASEDLTIATSMCKKVQELPASSEESEGQEVPYFSETSSNDSGKTNNLAEKGEKGDVGPPGPQGESVTGPRGPPGPVGPRGDIGPPGPRGEEGTCECSEDVVSQIVASMPKLKGPQGLPGPRGDEGPRGLPGTTGQTGAQGDTGPRGEKGDKGDRGYDGTPGAPGLNGPKGEPGRDGAPGIKGIPGPSGPPGPPGPVPKDIRDTKEVSVPGEKGETGPTGPPGIQGEKGVRGEKGEKGMQGLKGEKGDVGQQGLAGSKGDRGSVGIPGQNGIPGVPGSDGRHGEKGEKGEIGEKGFPGHPGMPAKLSSLLDPETDPYENAAIVEKLRGYKGDTGERGEKGDKGHRGVEGPPGQPGKDGEAGVKGDRGVQGPTGPVGPEGRRGDKGDRGEPGLPGNVTPAEIELIRGPKGDRGAPGKPGARGATGPRGPTGSRGYKGQRGEAGPRGPAGLDGQNGKDGLPGQKGERGDPAPAIDIRKVKGEKGNKGDSGRPGENGQPGPPGAMGPPGPAAPVKNVTQFVPVPGPPGPPGLPGTPGPPGVSITGPKGEPGNVISQSSMYNVYQQSGGGSGDEDEWYTSATIIYKTVRALIKGTSTNPVGTLAYVIREQALLLRVERGWQYVTMGSYLMEDTAPHITTHAPQPIVVTTERHHESMSTRPSLRLIALDAHHTGGVVSPMQSRGFSAADHNCNLNARNEKIIGSFVPFLTSRGQDLKSLVFKEYHNLPIVNLYGELLFNSWSSIFDGSGGFISESMHIYSFNGTDINAGLNWSYKAIWHGGDTVGRLVPDMHCSEWYSSSPNVYGMASSLHSRKLLSQERYPCNRKLIVLCIEYIYTGKAVRRRHLRTRRKNHNRHWSGLHNITSNN